MYVLRPYQDEQASAAIEAFSKGKPFILVAATAAGKSLIIAEITKRLGKPLLVLQPSREILLQNYEKMVSYSIEDVKMYSASVGKKEIGKITLATIGSIHRKPKDFAHFEHAIIDEVHTFNATKGNSMYMKLFRDTNIRNVCGLTATPFRLDNKFFGDEYVGCIKMLNRMTKDSFFKNIVHKVEMAELIEQGYLTKPQYHSFDTDMSELVVNTTGRDYTEESLERWSDNKLSNLAGIAHTLDKKHQRVLVFCSSLRQAGRAVELLGGARYTRRGIRWQDTQETTHRPYRKVPGWAFEMGSKRRHYDHRLRLSATRCCSVVATNYVGTFIHTNTWALLAARPQ